MMKTKLAATLCAFSMLIAPHIAHAHNSYTYSTIGTGIATYYNPGIMEQVLANRGISCTHCIGYVALLDANRIGDIVYLQRDGGEVEGPFMVSDTAGRNVRASLEARGWVVDVDWQTAQRWAMRGPLSEVSVLYRVSEAPNCTPNGAC